MPRAFYRRTPSLSGEPPPAWLGVAIDADHLALLDGHPGLVGDVLGRDEDGAPVARPRRFEDRARFGRSPAHAHGVTRIALEQEQRAAGAVGIEVRAVAEEERGSAEIRPR